MFPSLEVFENRTDEQQSRIAQLQLILPWAREAKLVILYGIFHSYDSMVEAGPWSSRAPHLSNIS